MKTLTFVWVTTRFAGYHRWKDAPDEVAFLRDWHRHVFHVKLSVPVSHDDRDVEFILLKRRLDVFIRDRYEEEHFEKSCEAIAREIMTEFSAWMCEVSEDGENGATVVKEMDLPPHVSQQIADLFLQNAVPHIAAEMEKVRKEMDDDNQEIIAALRGKGG